MESGSKTFINKIYETLSKNKLIKHCFILFIYGFLLEIVLAFVFNRLINFYDIIPIGIAWHFIKYELPIVVLRYTGGN